MPSRRSFVSSSYYKWNRRCWRRTITRQSAVAVHATNSQIHPPSYRGSSRSLCNYVQCASPSFSALLNYNCASFMNVNSLPCCRSRLIIDITRCMSYYLPYHCTEKITFKLYRIFVKTYVGYVLCAVLYSIPLRACTILHGHVCCSFCPNTTHVWKCNYFYV